LRASSDAESCDGIIASLPYHFGQESGIAACSKAVRSQPGFVAETDGEAVVGFITVDSPFAETVEITWLAVHADHRRGGIGRLLVERAVVDARARGATFLMVETVGPSEPEPGVTDGYVGTRAFYARLGFVQLKEFDFAGWSDRAIVLVRVL
jgi:ribosomal protein S18 acetylase RimI-like enzyme